MDNHDFLRLEGLQLAGPITLAQPKIIKSVQSESIGCNKFLVFWL